GARERTTPSTPGTFSRPTGATAGIAGPCSGTGSTASTTCAPRSRSPWRCRPPCAITEAMAERRRIGLLGARGYVGAELVRLVLGHPELELAYLGSRSLAGRPLRELVPEADPALVFEAL